MWDEMKKTGIIGRKSFCMACNLNKKCDGAKNVARYLEQNWFRRERNLNRFSEESNSIDNVAKWKVCQIDLIYFYRFINNKITLLLLWHLRNFCSSLMLIILLTQHFNGQSNCMLFYFHHLLYLTSNRKAKRNVLFLSVNKLQAFIHLIQFHYCLLEFDKISCLEIVFVCISFLRLDHEARKIKLLITSSCYEWYLLYCIGLSEPFPQIFTRNTYCIPKRFFNLTWKSYQI